MLTETVPACRKLSHLLAVHCPEEDGDMLCYVYLSK